MMYLADISSFEALGKQNTHQTVMNGFYDRPKTRAYRRTTNANTIPEKQADINAAADLLRQAIRKLALCGVEGEDIYNLVRHEVMESGCGIGWMALERDRVNQALARKPTYSFKTLPTNQSISLK